MNQAALAIRIGELETNYDCEQFTQTCHSYVEEQCQLSVGAANDRSWRDCYTFLVNHLPKGERYGKFHLVFELMMPESLKRADVLLLTASKVILLEFKQKSEILKKDITQVAGYAQSIRYFHYQTSARDMQVLPYMVYTRSITSGRTDFVPILQASNFTQTIMELLEGEQPMTDRDCEAWVESPFHPLKNIADATLQLFRDGDLPNIKNIREGDIQDTLEAINRVIDDQDCQKSMLFVTGVPGAGKPLVGLKTVYDHANTEEQLTPIYLSGNDPLVDILQKTLSASHVDRDGESFVQPMKNFKKLAYGNTVPLHSILVFDEA